jgi:hypothetical protein
MKGLLPLNIGWKHMDDTIWLEEGHMCDISIMQDFN